MSKCRVALRHTVTVFLSLLIPLFPTQVRGGDFSGTVEAGFDSFTEQYTIVEEDTLAQLNEVNSRLHLRYLTGSLFGSHFLVEGRSMVGGRSVENTGHVGFMYRGTTNRLFAEGAVTGRKYRENTNYSFPNDFLRYNTRVYFQRQLTPLWSVRLSNRFEAIDFDQRTEFDYDYFLNRVILSTDIESGLATGYQAGIGYSHKEIPDSTQIEYDGITGLLEYRHTTGLHKTLLVSTQAERRVYRDSSVRSPYWTALLLANINPIVAGNFGGGLDFSGETYRYDLNTNAYFDYSEARAFLFASYFRGFAWTSRLGPVGGLLLSGFSRQDEYYQFGVRFTIDYFSSDRVWVSASYEPGHRDYLLTAPSENEQIFSDFTYHSVSLITTLRLFPRMSFNLFAEYEPQNHSIRRDDSSSALFAANIAYSF